MASKRTATIKDLEAGETDRNTNAGEEHDGEVVGEHGGGVLFKVRETSRGRPPPKRGQKKGLGRVHHHVGPDPLAVTRIEIIS